MSLNVCEIVSQWQQLQGRPPDFDGGQRERRGSAAQQRPSSHLGELRWREAGLDVEH